MMEVTHSGALGPDEAFLKYGRGIEVFCDGVLVDHCFLVNQDEGWADYFVMDPETGCFKLDMTDPADPSIMSERVHGNITLVVP